MGGAFQKNIIMNKITAMALSLLFFNITVYGQATFSGGKGTKEDPFKISCEKDLRILADEVNSKKNTYEGKYFLQTEDIKFSDELVTPIGGPSLNDFSVPDEMSFKGTYDGGMHKIYNLNMYDNEQLGRSEEMYMNVGLFGSLGDGATIKNIVIASGTIYGYYDVGAIAGSINSNGTITHCKVGPDVRVNALANGAGIVGASVGSNILISECANYSNVNVYGQGQFKSGGGIIASSANGKVVGCANFGDVWVKGGFSGGIIGYMPLSLGEFLFEYPEMQSCMNGGDITSMEPCSAGLIGAVGYNRVDENNNPIPHQQISNSYSYGQSFVCYSKTNGPIIAFFINTIPITVDKTFYDADRYFMKKDPTYADQDVSFALGEDRTHQEILSNRFLEELNDGGKYLFEKDIHNMNKTMPVLKWINDCYDPEIDRPNQYRTDLKPRLFKRHAGSFFPPNRKGDFLIYNIDQLQPNAQAKSIGCSIDKGWIDRVLSVQGGDSYTYFMSSSDLRKPIGEDGMYVKGKNNQSVDHWIITPEFEVTEKSSKFTWEAASEDSNVLSGYKVYISTNENATSPNDFTEEDHVYTANQEPVMKHEIEKIDDEDYEYYIFNQHSIDLSKYIGKKIRVAFRDNSSQKFNILIGKLNVSSPTSSQEITSKGRCSVCVMNGTISASCIDAELELFNMKGELVSHGKSQIIYENATLGFYILKAVDQNGYTVTKKISVK